MAPKLLPDWKDILRHAWSAWMFYALIVVSALETLFGLAGSTINAALPAGVYPLITGVVGLLGVYLRVVAQNRAEKLTDDIPDADEYGEGLR